MLYELGRVCLKLAGRDAGKKCVVIEVIDDTYVLVEGQTRRKKCNVLHLEPLNIIVKVAKGASRDVVAKALAEHDIVVGAASKPKKTADKPLAKRAIAKPAKAPKPAKKAAKSSKPAPAKKEAPKKEQNTPAKAEK